MASTLRKLADKLEGKDKQPDNVQSSNFGPHSNSAANKVDPLVDSDLDGRNDPTSRVGGYGNTQTAGVGQPHSTNTGIHGTSHTTTTHTTTGSGGPGSHAIGSNPQSTNIGPHSSNLANKLDPRVDSDGTTGTTGYGNTHNTTGGGYGNTHATSGNVGNDPRSTNVGPHSSNLMNKLDPRVDSDVDGRNDPTSRTGGYGHTQHTAGGGYGNTHTASGNISSNQSTNAGPHSSNLMNKLDPRVDSDLDNRNGPSSRVGGVGHTHTATHGAHTGAHTTTGAQGYTGTDTMHNDPRSTNTGPHSSNLLNKLDPRVDSDRDGRDDPTSRTGGYGQTQTGTGGVGRY